MLRMGTMQRLKHAINVICIRALRPRQSSSFKNCKSRQRMLSNLWAESDCLITFISSVDHTSHTTKISLYDLIFNIAFISMCHLIWREREREKSIFSRFLQYFVSQEDREAIKIINIYFYNFDCSLQSVHGRTRTNNFAK